MEKQQKKDMNRTYTQFIGGEIQMEDYPVRMVLHHLPEGLLSSSVSTLDQKQVWICEHTGKQRLSEYCDRKELASEDLRWIYGGILSNLKETQEFLLDENRLFLNPEEVYLDNVEHRIWNCYIPFYEKDIWQSLRELSQYILGHLDQRDSEAVRIAYGMFQYFAQCDCSIEEAWEILFEKAVFENEEHTDQKEAAAFIEVVQEENNSDKINREPFPIVGWLIMGFFGAAAIFIFAYVFFNEWYLSDNGKILMLSFAIILGFVGILMWKYWNPRIKKKNPLKENSLGIVESETDQVRLVHAETGDTIVVSQLPSFIGKLSEKTSILIKEPTVSRIHGKLFCNGGEYYLEDMNSKNGTYVNGVRLEPEKPVRLKEGDELAFANIHYYFRL